MFNSTNKLIRQIVKSIFSRFSAAGVLKPANGGTGVNNGTNALTVPATGTAALLGTANVFTAAQSMTAAKILDSGGDHYITVDTASNEAADRTLTIPALGGDDTLMTLGTAQTVTGIKTFPNGTQFVDGDCTFKLQPSNGDATYFGNSSNHALFFKTNNTARLGITADGTNIYPIFNITTSLGKSDTAFTSLFLGEISEPSNPSANIGVLFVKDNGAGKSQLCVRFASGASQVIATEP